MPNWVDIDFVIEINHDFINNEEDKIYYQNRLDDLKHKVRSNEEEFDANKIKPMPKELLNYTPLMDRAYNIWYGNHYSHKEKKENEKKELLFKHGGIVKRYADEMKRRKEKYGSFNWYGWALENWGSKWGVVDSCLENDFTDRKQYNFFSPWCPPVELIDILAKKYPEFIFSMESYESGTSTYEYHQWENGELEVYDAKEYTGGRGG